jgi:hypothetical protein
MSLGRRENGRLPSRGADRQLSVGVKEVKALDVDRELHTTTGAGAGRAAHARGQPCAARVGIRVLILAGKRAPGLARVDREQQVRLGAEVLDDVAGDLDPR